MRLYVLKNIACHLQCNKHVLKVFFCNFDWLSLCRVHSSMMYIWDAWLHQQYTGHNAAAFQHHPQQETSAACEQKDQSTQEEESFDSQAPPFETFHVLQECLADVFLLLVNCCHQGMALIVRWTETIPPTLHFKQTCSLTMCSFFP